MTDHELERRLRAWYRSEIDEDEVAPPMLRASLGAIPATLPAPRRWMGLGRRTTLLAAAALLTTALVGGALFLGPVSRRSPSVVPSPDGSIPPSVATPTLEATVTPSSTPSQALPGSPLGGGWIIAYDPGNRSGPVDVLAIDAGGDQRTLLGTLPFPSLRNEWVFQWAGDRARVLLSRGIGHQENRALDTLTEAGRRLSFICCLPPNDGWGPPVLSPSGDKIAVGGGVLIGELSNDSFKPLPLPAGAEVHGFASWSPDESAVVVAGCSPCTDATDSAQPTRPEHGHLYIQSLDGTPTRQVLDETRSNFGSPAWSPDGSTILILRVGCTPTQLPPFCEGPASIGAVSVATGAPTTLITVGPELDGWGPPVWSPDGARIAFTAPNGLVVMDRHGQNQVVLDVGRTEFMAPNLPGPKWSPDGQWLMFMRGDNLWVVTADGGPERRVGTYRGADW